MGCTKLHQQVPTFANDLDTARKNYDPTDKYIDMLVKRISPLTREHISNCASQGHREYKIFESFGLPKKDVTKLNEKKLKQALTDNLPSELSELRVYIRTSMYYHAAGMRVYLLWEPEEKCNIM